MSNNKVPKKVKPVRAGVKNPRQTSSTVTYLLAGLAIVVVIVVIVVGIVANKKDGKTGAVPDDQLASSALFTAVKPGADPKVTLDLFEDFQCPVCKQFEAAYGAQITQAINDGKLRARFHMLTFLNRNSGSGDYSSRAAGAAKSVGNENNTPLFLAFHSKMYDVQPEEGKADPDNAQIAQFAGQVGASPATQQQITVGADIKAADALADTSMNQLQTISGGNVGTPSLVHDGKMLEWQDPNWLTNLLK